MSTNWSIAFKPILDLHSKAIFAAGSSSVGKPVVRKIRRAILTARDEQEEPIALPTSLKKVTKLLYCTYIWLSDDIHKCYLQAIKEYYAKSLKDKEEADECEAVSRPREPSFYKKPLSEYQVLHWECQRVVQQHDTFTTAGGQVCHEEME